MRICDRCERKLTEAEVRGFAIQIRMFRSGLDRDPVIAAELCVPCVEYVQRRISEEVKPLPQLAPIDESEVRRQALRDVAQSFAGKGSSDERIGAVSDFLRRELKGDG